MRRDRIGPEWTVDLHVREAGGRVRISLDDCGCAMDVPWTTRRALGFGRSGSASRSPRLSNDRGKLPEGAGCQWPPCPCRASGARGLYDRGNRPRQASRTHPAMFDEDGPDLWHAGWFS
jgi:hypothetical protein